MNVKHLWTNPLFNPFYVLSCYNVVTLEYNRIKETDLRLNHYNILQLVTGQKAPLASCTDVLVIFRGEKKRNK